MNEVVLEILALLVKFIAAVVAVLVVQLAKKYLDTETKRQFVREAVRYVEQKCKDIHGTDKLHRAIELASAELTKYHINATPEELEFLIESTVGGFNEVFNK